MNLAFITKCYGRAGGTEVDLFELTHRLAARGHAVHIYCYDIRMEAADGVELHRIPVIGFGRLAKFLSLAVIGVRKAYAGGHDLVISYAKVPRQDVIRCEGGTHRQYMTRLLTASTPLKKFLRSTGPYHRSVLRTEGLQFQPGHYRRILAISKSVKEEVMEVYGVPDRAVEVVYSGVDARHFHPDNRERHRTGIRAELGIAGDASILIFVGSGFKRKGLDVIIRALAVMDQEMLHLVVVGGDSKMLAYQGMTADAGLKENIHFVGIQRDPAPYYASADALILTSFQEAFGNVLLEAMAVGVPGIVTRCTGCSEILQDALADYVLEDPNDEKALAGLIQRILTATRDEHLSKLARSIAEQYSLDRHAETTEAEYEQVLKATLA